jgi:hypothetical protein
VPRPKYSRIWATQFKLYHDCVPPPSQHATDHEAEPHLNGVNGTHAHEAPPAISDEASDATEPTALLPVLREPPALPAPVAEGPHIRADPGLYAVLGLDPSVTNWEIQTTYRRMASRLMGSGSRDAQALKQLNIAYEVLGNPARRTEYDRQRLHQALAAGTPTPIRPGAKSAARVTRRRRPRHIVQPRYAGLGDVMVVLTVVGLAIVAAFLLIPRLSINLTALNALQVVLPNSSAPARRVLDVTVTAVPTAAPTATPLPSVAARYAGTNVSVSNPTPAQNTPESVQIRLRRDGQPQADSDVWASVEYRTTQERWPPTGTVKTDASGAATITFNIGSATPNYPVTVHVFTQADDQQLSWSTTFTPH